MSVGRNLQEMENVVTKGATPAESPSTSATPVVTPGQTVPYEDLGGPTPENYRPDDDSSKLKDPSVTLAQVKNVVNAKAAAADPMASVKEETEEDEDDLVDEEEVDEEEVDSTDEEEVEEEFSIEEDVNALLAGEDLSEEFQEKARTIFEAALRSKVSQIRESLEEQYSNVLAEEVEEIKTELADRVDAYLEYVADEWISENALAVEHGLKTEMTESFLEGMRGLFEAHYVSIPEEKYNVIESMVEKLD